MYGFKKALLALKDEISELTDPDADNTKFLKNVIYGRAENIGLYNGTLASLVFTFTPKTGAIGARRQGERAIIEGRVILYLPGVSGSAVLNCVHYCDIIGDFFETPNEKLKQLGIELEKDEDSTHDWHPVNVSETKKPKMCVTGTTKFRIVILKE